MTVSEESIKIEIERYILKCKHEGFSVKDAVSILYEMYTERPSKHLLTEWGGSMCAVINGEVKNIAEHLNEKERDESKVKYYIKLGDQDELEVTKERFIQTERFCGFYPKIDGETATTSFGFMKDGLEIKGRKG